MGHKNDLLFVERNLHRTHGRVLEIGAKKYPGSFIDYRNRFSDFTGMDQEAGENVDIVHNLESGPLPDKFGTILCLNVLEHTPRPWIVAAHVLSMLEDGGILIASTPWIWRRHNYPGDFFRCSVPGLKSLFDGLTWVDEGYASTMEGEFLADDEPWRNGIVLQSEGIKRNVVVSEIAYVAGVKN